VKLPRIGRQDVHAVRGDGHVFLHPHAAQIRDVDPRLHGEGEPRRCDRGVARDYRGNLVSLDPEAVTHPMREVPVVTRLAQDPVGRLVQGRQGDARPDRLQDAPGPPTINRQPMPPMDMTKLVATSRSFPHRSAGNPNSTRRTPLSTWVTPKTEAAVLGMPDSVTGLSKRPSSMGKVNAWTQRR